MIAHWSSRKFIVALFAIGCVTLLGLTKHPEVAGAIATIAGAFLAAHGIADSKWGARGPAA